MLVIGKLFYFIWFIISVGVLLILNKASRITQYIKANHPVLYNEKRSRYNQNLNNDFAVNIYKLNEQDINQIADENMKNLIYESKINGIVFMMSFVIMVIVIFI